MERLVLDTSVWIQIERGLEVFDELVSDHQQLLLPAIVLAELKVSAQDPKRTVRQNQASLSFVTTVQKIAEFVPVDEAVVSQFALLRTHCRQVGKPRSTADLLVAATALAHDAKLKSFDGKAEFAEQPNLREMP